MAPLAYFITFTTYGTWLHGTNKGLGSVDRKHNNYGAEYVAPDVQRVDDERERLTQPAYVMTAPERQIACNAMV